VQSDVPLVGVVMGSDSDWPVMGAAAEVLDEFGVAYEADVVSAHRMPREMIAYGEQAASRGLKVIIAGAGGAAHLPGMLAAVTPLPVIGVPVPLKYLDGMDSLLSIVQMPAGIPVATVAVGGARNAGLLAVRILAASDDDLRAHMIEFQARLTAQAKAKGAALRENLLSLRRATFSRLGAPASPDVGRCGPDRKNRGRISLAEDRRIALPDRRRRLKWCAVDVMTMRALGRAARARSAALIAQDFVFHGILTANKLSKFREKRPDPGAARTIRAERARADRAMAGERRRAPVNFRRRGGTGTRGTASWRGSAGGCPLTSVDGAERARLGGSS
jgi:5-(carboxyamino)imidazole ribonucleotide mutase